MRSHTLWLTLVVGIATLGVIGAPPLAGPAVIDQQSSVRVISDVRYYRGPNADPDRQALDLFIPEGAERAPVVVFVHGGGWVTDDKDNYPNVGRTFAQAGFLTVLPNYRLSPAVRHPAHATDVARAYAWIRDNIADYGGNPDEIVLSGHSAGGHLAALVTLDERFLRDQDADARAIQGLVGISAVYDLNATPGFNAVFGSDPDARREASPIAHIDSAEPPFLGLYAEFDLPTLPDQAERFTRAYTRAGNEGEVAEVAGKLHPTIVTDIGEPGDPTTARIRTFLREQTRDPDLARKGAP